MPNPAFESVEMPFTAFRFEVVLNLDDPPSGLTNPVCDAAFAECSGLDITLALKTVRQGGDNLNQIQRTGPASYGQITLRRGMTANLALWNWVAAAAKPGRNNRAQGQVTLWAPDGTPQLVFVLADCLPARVSGPSLNAQNGQVALEELQLAYGSLTVRLAGQSGVGASVGISAGVSASASLSVSGGPGLSASASASASAGLSFG